MQIGVDWQGAMMGGLTLAVAPATLWAACVVLAVCLGVTLGVLLWTRRSLREVQDAAELFAKGELSGRVAVQGPQQVAELSASLNRMSGQLQERLETVIQQRSELEAVLASMVEGVLAIDQDEKLISLNRAAAQLLQIAPFDALGRTVYEVARNPALQDFVSQVLSSESPVQSDLTVQRPASSDHPGDVRELYLQVQGAALRDSMGVRIGGLIVLHDVTQLRRLENIRRDFVANVSHEVKTPISTIKAAAETLIESAGDGQAGEPEFVRIIARQADRLHAIVDDLLALARLEQEGAATGLDCQIQRVLPVLRAAVETANPSALERRQVVETTCEPEDLTAPLNPRLLEQAVVNLLENAVKYSPEGSHIYLEARQQGDEVVIQVRDDGPGIEARHLPRLFERFYRTDKARSRAAGGTGLGLAIVKHVAQALGGRVSVSSQPGRGSTFRIHLPSSQPSAAWV